MWVYVCILSPVLIEMMVIAMAMAMAMVMVMVLAW